MFWGLTPSLDLLKEYEALHNLPDELNILIVGGADCRHVIKTVAQKYRHQKIKINFFLMDACCEVIAKQMLLLHTALQPSQYLDLVQKTRIFMELFGNTLVRPAIAKYLTGAAFELIKMITNLEYMKEAMPIVKLLLKYKERDYLENIFKFWCSNDNFEICDSWDRRLRKALGVRYDTKINAFDWDLHMRLHSVGGRQVCNQEYKSFRAMGVAFTWLESEVSKPNRSLVCAVVRCGEEFLHHGYLGDMETGPFIAYGLDCEDATFLKQTNGTNAYRSTDVTERNLRQIFYELEESRSYINDENITTLGNVIAQVSPMKVIDIGAAGNLKRKPSKCFAVDDVSVSFVSISYLEQMKYKQEYKNQFHLIYFASTYLKYLDVDVVNNISADNTLLLIENQIFVLSHRENQLNEYGESVMAKIKEMKAHVISYDCQKDSYAKFMLKNNVK